jgi:ubiquinone/menaquinone biosynthesis C-methylase UbiE
MFGKESQPSNVSATSIWDARYKEEKLACTVKTVKADPIDYTQHPFLWKHSVAKRLTGSIDKSPTALVMSRFLVPPAKKLLSIGCGIASSEENLVKQGFVEHVTAFEASTVAIDNAKKRLGESGLLSKFEFYSEDILSAGIPDATFDVIYVAAAIHHFAKIEEMFELMHRVLKPNGLLIYDEYIGPDHHLYDEHVYKYLDEINDCLAEKYRRDFISNGAIRNIVPRATLEQMLELDPSEGVHASMILPLTYKYFDVERRGDYGGSVMRRFFCGILTNFDFEDPEDQTIGRLIILIEDILLRTGQLPHYHTTIVGRRRDVPRENLTAEQTDRINYSDWDSRVLNKNT